MPQIVLDGTGVPKSNLVEGAYGYCGLNGYEYERTPEEMTTGLRHLNAMMAEWLADGIDLGFDFPTYAQGVLEEPSGVPNHAVSVIHQKLAQRLAPGMGASLGDDAKAALATSWQGFQARMAAAPPSIKPAARMTTSGVRHGRFLATPTS